MSRPVKKIQAELKKVANEVEATAKRLRLEALMTELEQSYPEDLDTEQIGEGEICPPLAWEIHADVGNAKILLEEVVVSLSNAGRRTVQQVRHEWVASKLKEVNDPASRSLLGFLLGTGDQ